MKIEVPDNVPEPNGTSQKGSFGVYLKGVTLGNLRLLRKPSVVLQLTKLARSVLRLLPKLVMTGKSQD